MAQKMIPKGNYCLVGLGTGSLIGVLFAPKSGEKTREYIAMKTKEGNELARKKAQELRVRLEEAVDNGMEMIAQTEGQIVAAINVGRETYHRENAKALERLRSGNPSVGGLSTSILWIWLPAALFAVFVWMWRRADTLPADA